METSNFEIRRIKRDEVSIIRNLLPPDWNIDLEKVYDQHYGHDYFYSIVALTGYEIVGTGMAVINDNSTWLGIIIVKENHRNKGLGKDITNHLISYSKSKGIDTIILAASDLGLPVYKKIGFEHDLNYNFFKTDNPVKVYTLSRNISEITKNEYSRVLELDFAISGERRENLLLPLLKTGFKFKDKFTEGYYLPDFGEGMIIADSERSGIELLRFKLSLKKSSVCVPETNIAVIDYLKSVNYYQYFTTPRMFLSKNVNWESAKVYSRGCGYLG